MKNEIYTKHRLVEAMIDNWYLERGHDTDIFHKTKVILTKILDKSLTNNEFGLKYLDWLNQKTSTIELRDICRSVGHDYWEDLINTNAINTIDSVRLWWAGKQEDIIERKKSKL